MMGDWTRLCITHQPSFDHSCGDTLIYTEIFPLAHWVLHKFDLFKILLHAGELCEDGMLARFDAIESQIGWKNN
jgi:hypothetical protein